MEKILTLLLLVVGFSLQAQTTDFNTNKKGFVADGYDVVSYFSDSAEEGKNKYVSEHDGVKYKFSSQENLDKFNTEPQKFIPQYGGYCAYALAVKGKKVSINPKTFEIRDDKLYLFYNSWGNNTLKSWLKESPDDLKVTADENWKKLN